MFFCKIIVMILNIVLIIVLILIIIYLSRDTLETFKTNSHDDFFKNKTVLVTGSSRGIGLSIAELLLKHKCNVIICGKNADTLENALNILKDTKRVKSVKADLSTEKGIDNLFNTAIDSFGTIDILINNVISKSGSNKLTNKSYKEWKNEIDTNIHGIFYLTQKTIQYMKKNNIKGRIFNISSQQSKSRDTRLTSGTEVLSKSFVERMSDLLSEENDMNNITISTIRIDSGNFKGNKKPKDSVKDYASDFIDSLYDKPEEVSPVILEIMSLPHRDLNGKIYSTAAFKEDKKNSNIVPSHQILLNKRLYKAHKLTRSKKNNNQVYLSKQNPYGLSKNIQKKIKAYNFNNSVFNVNTTVKNSKLLKALSLHLKVNKERIVFFKTEQDALKKIVTTFVPKYNNLFSVYPAPDYLEILTSEQKIEVKYTTYKVNKESIQVKYKHILNYINSKTKMIILSSPNTLTGQSIIKKEFDAFLEKVPSNIIILIDQTYIDYVNKKVDFDPIYYKHKNIIVLRSFSNFYGFENLELTYAIAHKSIAEILYDSTKVQTQVDPFNEYIALAALNDKENTKKVKSSMDKERKRIYGELKKSNIDYYPSEVNYILIKPEKEKDQIEKTLYDNDIILEKSDLHYDDYWALPLSKPDINDKVLECIVSQF